MPIANVTQTPSIGGETQYQIQIPPTSMYASHAYRLSVTAVGGNFEWDTSSAGGCCGGSTGTNWVRGRAQSYLAMPNVSFSLDNSSTPAAPLVTSPPANTSVTVGQSFSFVAAASGSPAPTVQWQVSTDGGATYSDIAGATATTYSGIATLADNASQVRAVFTNGSGSAITSAATFTVTPAPAAPLVISPPANTSVTVGQSFSFVAAASGSPTPTVQWQVSTDGGATYSDIVGATATTYSGVATLADNASQVRAVFTNGSGSAITSAAALTVTSTTSVMVTSTVLAPKFGQQTKLIATVTSPTTGTKKVTAGTVSFFDGAVPVASATVKAGKASVTVAFAAGSHGITAVFGGSGAVLTAQSTLFALPVGQAGTSVVMSGPLKEKAGLPATFAVTVVTAAPAKGVATGTVTLQDGAAILGTVSLDATGKATFTTIAFAVGVHTITATYGGDPNHGTSSASRATTIS